MTNANQELFVRDPEKGLDKMAADIAKPYFSGMGGRERQVRRRIVRPARGFLHSMDFLVNALIL
jgi:hypothetical protein